MKRIILLLILPFGLAAQSDRIQVTDLTRIQQVAGVSVAKNKIIYTVSAVKKK